VAQDLETRIAKQMRNISSGTGEEVVDTDDFVPLSEQHLAQMTPDKARAARYKDPLHFTPHHSKTADVTVYC